MLQFLREYFIHVFPLQPDPFFLFQKKLKFLQHFEKGMSHMGKLIKQCNMQSEILVTAIVFYGFYYIIKLISEHFLKSRLIKAGHVDKAGILEKPAPNAEVNQYPSLKWGLVALTTGLGFIIIEIMRQINPSMIDYHNASLPIGILLVFISLGFLVYFFIINRKRAF
jgi:hypothetical protein